MAYLQMDGEDSGAEYNVKLNETLIALYTMNASATPPADTTPFMLWQDTSSNPPTRYYRNEADSAWIEWGAGGTGGGTGTGVTSWNSRVGSVNLTTSDVLNVLPSTDGKAGQLLSLNSSENGLVWRNEEDWNWVFKTSGSTPNNVVEVDLRALYGTGRYLVEVGDWNLSYLMVSVGTPPIPAAFARTWSIPIPDGDDSDSPANSVVNVSDGVMIGDVGQCTSYKIWKAQ